MMTEQIEKLKKLVLESQVYKSMFRRGFAETPRNRVLAIMGNVFLHLHPSHVARHSLRFSHSWCMGGITFLLFLVLCFTGVFLCFYYHPDKIFAYKDMKYFEYDVPFGIVLRNMHRWAAHLMVITVWLHMTRVFMTGSYKPPREFNWVVGVLLLVLTLLLSFTVYLLPWDQLSIWAVTVGSNMDRATPLLGYEGPLAARGAANPIYDARAFLFGGGEIGPHTLLRFYILHCIFIPMVASILMAVHFWRIRRDGFSGPSL